MTGGVTGCVTGCVSGVRRCDRGCDLVALHPVHFDLLDEGGGSGQWVAVIVVEGAWGEGKEGREGRKEKEERRGVNRVREEEGVDGCGCDCGRGSLGRGKRGEEGGLIE